MDSCPNCAAKVPEHCYNAVEKRTTGWWCTTCNHFERAIGRERMLAPAGITYGFSGTEEYSESEPTGEIP